MNYETLFLIGLLKTLIVEISVLILFFKYIFKKKITSKLFIVGFIASTLTLPYLWFVLPSLLSMFYLILLGELLVIFIEAYIYNQFLNLDFKKALYLSLIANISSIIIGLL